MYPPPPADLPASSVVGLLASGWLPFSLSSGKGENNMKIQLILLAPLNCEARFRNEPI